METPTTPPTPKNTGKNEPKSVIRVSISEAARLFGVNAQTIRRAIQSREITYVVVSGRYKVNFESLVKWSQYHTTIKNKTAKRGIGQFVDRWKIKNPLFSPNPKLIGTKAKEGNDEKPPKAATEKEADQKKEESPKS